MTARKDNRRAVVEVKRLDAYNAVEGEWCYGRCHFLILRSDTGLDVQKRYVWDRRSFSDLFDLPWMGMFHQFTCRAS
jgi:hypothetical protein